MKQLCQNIANNEPNITPGGCSPELRDLVKELLLKDCYIRPGINAVLMRPVVKNRISSFLDATKRSREFSHTGIRVEFFIKKLSIILNCIIVNNFKFYLVQIGRAHV